MTLKHSNRGAAMPAILALGIFIGASLALASPLGSRMGSRHIVEAGPTPTPGGGSGEAGRGSCPAAVRSLDVGNQGYPRAIDAVPERCERNPNEEWNAGQASQASGNGVGVRGPEGHDEGGGPSDQSDEPGDEGSEDAEPGDEGSEDHGNSGHGDHDPNGNAYGHFDGKGNNG